MNTRNIPHPTDASIILTYRCPMKCKMCNIWFNPTKKDAEIKACGPPYAAAPEIHQPDRRRTLRPRGSGGNRGGVLQTYGPHRHLHVRMVRRQSRGAWPKQFPQHRHPHLDRRTELQERRTARTCRRLRQGAEDTAHAEADGAERHRIRLHRVEQQFQGYALALSAVAVLRHGVRYGGFPQLLLFPQGRQRNHQQGRGVQKLRAANRMAVAGEPSEKLVPRMVQYGADQLH